MAYYPDFPTTFDSEPSGSFFANPQAMALLGLSQGLLQAGQPTSRPTGIGGALGMGIQGALSGQMLAQQNINSNIKNKQQQTLIDLENEKINQSREAQRREADKQALLKPIIERFQNWQMQQNPMVPGPGASVMAGSGPQAPVAAPSQFPLSQGEIAALKLSGGPDLLPHFQASRPDLSIQNGFLVDKHGGIVGSTPQTNAQGFSTITVPDGKGGYKVELVPGGSSAFATQQQIDQAARSRFAPPTRVEPTAPGQNPRLENNYNLAVQAGAPAVLGAAGGATPSGLSPNQQAAADANREQQVAVAKDTAKIYNDLQNAAMQNPAKIAKTQRIGTLLQDFEGGKFSKTGLELARALNSAGFKVDEKLPAKEAAEALTNEVALELRSTASGAGMPGAMSDADREFLKSMTPQMSSTAEGRRTIVESRVKVMERENQVAKMAREYRKKHGGLDEDFFTQLQDWSNRNPIFKAK